VSNQWPTQPRRDGATRSWPHARYARLATFVGAALLATVAACSDDTDQLSGSSAAHDSGPAASGGASSEGERFETMPVGATLPSDEACAARVRPSPEIRPGNEQYNQTVGRQMVAAPDFVAAGRITGNYRGTTDEIIQWAACKWGIDEDVVRAQIARESWWDQEATGDFTDDPALCVPGHPVGADGEDGQCPESIGLGQVRAQYYRPYIEDSVTSTAFNLDVTYALWRSCYDGTETWLNTVERGKEYAAGDLWGCLGKWYSGRWYTDAANEYIGWVQDYLDDEIWTSSDFIRN
jgi:hypothetical protein